MGEQRHPVDLHIYDLSQGLAAQLGPILLGRHVSVRRRGVQDGALARAGPF